MFQTDIFRNQVSLCLLEEDLLLCKHLVNLQLPYGDSVPQGMKFIPVQKTLLSYLQGRACAPGTDASHKKQLCACPGAWDTGGAGAWSPRELHKYPKESKGSKRHPKRSPLVSMPPFGPLGSSWIVSNTISARTALQKAGFLPEKVFGGNKSWQKRCCRWRTCRLLDLQPDERVTCRETSYLLPEQRGESALLLPTWRCSAKGKFRSALCSDGSRCHLDALHKYTCGVIRFLA